MGNGRKIQDPRFAVHDSWYAHEKRQDVDIVGLENVTEYDLGIVKSRFPPPKYQVQSEKVDPRIFGDGCSRARLYAIIYKTSKYQWDANMPLSKFLDMLKMQPRMSALSYFFMDLPKSYLTEKQALKKRLIQMLINQIHDIFPKHVFPYAKPAGQAENLTYYQKMYPHLGVPDLQQLARTSRGRGETSGDRALPTLTTNTGLYSVDAQHIIQNA